MKPLCAFLLFTLAASAFSACTDTARYFDADGDGCSYYTRNPSACQYAANNRQGVSPREACCACGGGSGSLAPATTNLAARCTDRRNFYDADGDGCSYYVRNPNACYSARANKQGVSPRQACCACGGGNALLEEEFLDATVLATGCTDKRGFYDSEGDGCSYYTKNPGACANATPNRQGVSPRQACCACGGGSGLLEEDAAFFATGCTDKRGFYDSEGDGCSYYTKNPGACANATPNRQGVSPSQACCACGGGSGLLEEDNIVLATGCTDKRGFYDSEGDGCSYYTKNPGACANATPNRQGVSPIQACCACGGGSSSLEEEYLDAMSVLATKCTDRRNFYDADGDGCSYYTKNPGACANARANRQGVSPRQACCACGGGSGLLEEDATILAGKCTDRRNFYDADGDGCSYYTKNPGACANARANRQGVSPRQACCACGGGSGLLEEEFLDAAVLATGCTDKRGFYDSEGDGCSYYTKNPGACANATPNRQGVSPRQACCACGGGSGLFEEDAAFFATGCTDKRGFYDSEGDGCSYYTKNPGACANATPNRQGVSPSQACCACGGGTI